MFRFVSLVFLFLLAACAPSAIDLTSPVDHVTSAYLEQGINCETVALFTELESDQKDAVVANLMVEGGEHLFDDLLELGGGCMLEERLAAIETEPVYEEWSPESGAHRHIGAGTYIVEHISNTIFGSAGNYPSGIYVDQAAYQWMCGSSGGADYISLTWLSGAYTHLSDLKTKSRNPWSSCYLTGGSDARVYSDDHIAMCIGSGMVSLCGAIVPLTSDFTTRR